METLVVSAYPACGKTYFYEKYKDKYKLFERAYETSNNWN